MSATSLAAFIARCRALCRPREHTSDAELWRRFTSQGDADAFGQLLERYAPLVWGVCRRLLPLESDCEDAFQAVFLALVRRPDAIEPSQSLGAWLHTVAVRVAHRTRTRSRRQRPQAMLPERATRGDVAEEVGSRELFRMVDEEIARLPVAVRVPLILCCLQGRTRDEAAAALGCTVSTVKGRLERGRELLRRRLQQRGVSLPAAFLVLGLTSERIRAALWAKTMQSVLYTPAPAIAALAEAGISAGTIGKSKLILAALLLVSSAAGAVGTLLREKPLETSASPQAAAISAGKTNETPQICIDRYGDPLPKSAIARLGTVRWRHGFIIQGLAYSPDGKLIAAVGCGRAITLWDAATGKEVHQFPNGDQPSCVAFSRDSKMMATSGLHLFAHLWDVASGKELRQIGAGEIAFSPDGKLVTTAKYDCNTHKWDADCARIWDAKTGTELHCLNGKQGELRTAAYSPDGKLLAVASMNGVITLWDPATGTKRKQLTEHTKEVWKLVFSSDGKRLASSSTDGTIRLWTLATGKHSLIVAEKDGEHDTKPIAFSPDGSLLASGCGDGTIRLWEVKDGKEKRRWQTGALPVQAIAISPDGQTLASGSAWDCIRLWDLATGKEKHPSDGHRGFVELLRFSADGKSLISAGCEKRLIRWDLASTTPQRLFSWTIERFSFALSPDGNTLVASGWPDYQVRLWDVRTGKPGRLLGKRQPMFGAIAFSPDGGLVAWEGDNRLFHVWDKHEGKEIQQFKGFSGPASRLCFAPDSKALACAKGLTNTPKDKTPLRLWDIASGKECCSIASRADSVQAIAFSPDGKMLAGSEWVLGHQGGSTIRVWDAKTGAELCCHSDHGDSVSAIAFSPDGKLVVSGASGAGYRDNSIHIWEAATGRLIRRFEGHHSCISSVDFAPDGLMVASGAGDSTILLWDITGRRGDGRWHVKPLSSRQLDACWTALANEDAAKAYDAVWALAAAPEQAVPFLQKHLSPVPQLDAKRIARLIAELDSDDFPAREKASKELSKFGNAITPALQRALQNKPSAEVQRRIQQLLDQNRDWTPQRLRDHRAIQALEHIGTRQAKDVLQSLATGAPEALRTKEARAALRRSLK